MVLSLLEKSSMAILTVSERQTAKFRCLYQIPCPKTLPNPNAYGVLILLHDDTLDRTSDSAEVFGEEDVRPEDKTYEELRTLNMGAKFTAQDGSTPYKGSKGTMCQMTCASSG